MKPLTTLILTMATASSSFAADTFHDLKVQDIDGKELDLATLKGKAVLVVNVASQCGYTRQYETLQRLHEQFADKGLVVLGVPANNYGGQEPGSDAEIKAFCTTDYGVTFPMLAKVSADGADQAPIFRFLTGAENADFTGRISWNFEKFLVGKDGKLLRRFKSSAEPDGEEVIAAVTAALGS